LGTGRLAVQRGRGGTARWFYDGGMAVQWGVEGGGRRNGPSWGRAPFIAGRGVGWRAARQQNWGRETAAGSHGCSSRRCRDLEWSVRSERGWSVVQTGRLMGEPSGFDIFLELSKPTQIWKLKMDALDC
jgi:hypothetical protein